MSSESSYRYVNKNFFCPNCGKSEKKLVDPQASHIKCTICGMEANESNLEQYNREDLDRTYRIIFNQNNERNVQTNQYHNRTDIFDRNPNNIYADPREHVIHLSKEEVERRNDLINQNRQLEQQSLQQTTTFYPFINLFPNLSIRRDDQASLSNPNLSNLDFHNNYNFIGNQNNQRQSFRDQFDQLNRINLQNQNNIHNTNNLNNNQLVNNLNNESNDSFRTVSNPNNYPNLNSHHGMIPIIPNDLIFIPFVQIRSPFSGSVNRHRFNHRFHDFFTDFFFVQPSDEFFGDNYASNFTSNFHNPLTRIIFIRTINHNEMQNQPASTEALRRLKKFNMSEEYAKKSDKGEIEYPSCSVCLTQVNRGEDSILVPCGHIYHNNCIMKWFEINNKCPICRYELRDNRSLNYSLNNSFNRGVIDTQRNGNNNLRNNNNDIGNNIFNISPNENLSNENVNTNLNNNRNHPDNKENVNPNRNKNEQNMNNENKEKFLKDAKETNQNLGINNAIQNNYNINNDKNINDPYFNSPHNNFSKYNVDYVNKINSFNINEAPNNNTVNENKENKNNVSSNDNTNIEDELL